MTLIERLRMLRGLEPQPLPPDEDAREHGTFTQKDIAAAEPVELVPTGDPEEDEL